MKHPLHLHRPLPSVLAIPAVLSAGSIPYRNFNITELSWIPHIENAKNPEVNGNSDAVQVNLSGQTKKSPRSHGPIKT